MTAMDDYLRALFGAPPTPLFEHEVEVTGRSEVGPDSWVRVGARLHDAVLANDVFVGFRSVLAGCRVGPGTLIASGVRVGEPGAAPCRIGSGVWLGAGAEVAPGVQVGDGSVVAAGAVVKADVPAGGIVAGRPARHVSSRQAVDDGLPSFHALLRTVTRRQQGSRLLGQAMVRLAGDRTSQAAVGRALLVEVDPDLGSWQVGAVALVDADLSGGADVVLGDDVVLIGRGARTPGPWPTGGIELGDRTEVGAGAVLEGAGGITTGSDVRIGPGAHVLSSGHDHGRTSLPLTPTPVRIGTGARIGADALLVGPLDIGPGQVVPPGAVVLRDRDRPGEVKIVGTRTAAAVEGVLR
ncbi:hypothetical protein LZG04_16240 [Saccharothrix sp. S26]|uniref:acyltransferase n=1 Tax=Saccharothrix sp. S26 TaxID=2907215 RepID=UPI001F206532|nr:DapH/DapD/GlmU-related protein [Saccharothrix sp. S26]MCE6996335.1 hypothetical protein [Saccharothrix sp. S26]